MPLIQLAELWQVKALSFPILTAIFQVDLGAGIRMSLF